MDRSPRLSRHQWDLHSRQADLSLLLTTHFIAEEGTTVEQFIRLAIPVVLVPALCAIRSGGSCLHGRSRGPCRCVSTSGQQETTQLGRIAQIGGQRLTIVVGEGTPPLALLHIR